ncbi:MAG TPA: 6,7-dimethyl-8-ribityllumazine synthase [Verrucomicrobiae bacterium]|jgi:6,7-dimethyl-8-ribityllumazine synthase|nr:6,7-dimethyl-8-ribityllumazine synthase [Verrucomicrobiae bacterium]
MVKSIEGRLDARGIKFGIVVSRFNDFVTERLLEGALDALKAHGAQEHDIELVRVPGAFEIPLAAKQLAAGGRRDALICLGAIIRGDTPHFEYIADAVTRGLGALGLEYSLPVSFGVLTTNSVEQAMERAGAKNANKGYEAALTAIEMATLSRELSGKKR